MKKEHRYIAHFQGPVHGFLAVALLLKYKKPVMRCKTMVFSRLCSNDFIGHQTVATFSVYLIAILSLW